MMNKKLTMLGIALVSCSVLGTGVASAEVTSESEVTVEGDPLFGVSDAMVEIEEADDTTTPVDPEEPIEPEDGNSTGNSGILTIDYVPRFNFGKLKTGSSTVLQDQNSNPFVQVSDYRGDIPGWTLKLEVGKFVTSDENKTELKGAVLSVGNVTPIAVDLENQSTAPVGVAAEFTSDSQGPKTIMTAAAGTGAGTWKGKFQDEAKNNSVSLKIPAGNAIGSYSSTLTWTLSEAPE